MLQRLCITVRRQAIALTNYFEAAGSRRPGGDHGVGFFMCAACVVCCVVHEVFLCVLLVVFCVVCCVCSTK